MKQKRPSKLSGTITIPLPVVSIELPPEFERYVMVKTASDLLALGAHQIYQQILEKAKAKREKL